jgi:hypothetical protein
MGIKASFSSGITQAAWDNLLVNSSKTLADLDSAQNTKLNGIETGAEKNIGEEYTSEEKTKLSGIESGATADQTGAEIKTAYESQSNTNAFTDTEKNKVSNIEHESSEILQMKKQASAPENPENGDMYYDTNSNTYKYYHNSEWKTVKFIIEEEE